MSYQVLARRWRPQAFDQMVGQEHVLRALVNALDRDRLHHAYLLTGTRGVGKTTLARLVAKCLNCEQGVSSTPCGTCSACREIAEGRFVDLLEIDAASRTKVEDTRELLDNVQYAPARGRYKVYLIDEVHMLSSHSFNALLKTLEEPPPHVKFLLATTDPQRLPATVLSRCLQLHLRNLDPEQISGHLAYVLGQEGIASEPAALWELAVAAEGSMRDALSLTDQAIAHGGGQVLAATVTEMLGFVEREQLRNLVDALLAADAARALSAVHTLASQGSDCERVLSELLVELHRIALVQAVPAAVESLHGDREQVARWAAAADVADVQLYYQVGLQCRRDLPYAPDARSGLEMALMRMIAFRPAAAPRPGSPAPAGTPPPAREAGAGPKKPDPAGPAPAGATGQPGGPSNPAAQSRTVSPASAPLPVQPAAVAAVAAPVADPVPEEPDPGPEYEPLPPVPARLEELDAGNWVALLEALPVSGMGRSVAMNALPLSAGSGRAVFVVEQRHAMLQAPALAERLSTAFAAHYGVPVEVEVRLGTPDGETPAAREARLQAARRRAAVRRIEQDPNVRLLVENFGGRLHRDSIRPVGEPPAGPQGR